MIQPASLASRRIYEELLLPLEPGDLLAHEQWRRLGDYTALQTAQRRLQREQGRWLLNLRGVGYRLLTAAEHDVAQRNHKGRARRQVHQAIKAGDDAQLHPQEMTLEQAEAYRQTGQQYRAIYRLLRRHERQIQEVQAVTAEHEDRLSRLERQVQEMREP